MLKKIEIANAEKWEMAERKRQETVLKIAKSIFKNEIDVLLQP